MGLEERTQHAGPRPARPHARADWKQMVGIGVVASILGIAAGLLIDWFPVAASDEAKPIDTLWDVLIIFSVPVFVGVTVVVLFSVWKFRMRPGEENLDGPPIHGNTRLEVIWTAIPAILLVGLCTYAFIVLEDVEAVEGRPMEVRVVGEQFAWTFFYERDGEEVASRQLYLPIDRQVRFTLQSKDVLHDFWVPAFRMKKDAVPGIDVTYTVTPNRLGPLPDRVRGAVRARARGHALDRAWSWTEHEFDDLADRPRQARRARGRRRRRWRRRDRRQGDLRLRRTAASCHTLADAGTTGSVGPDLDDVLADKDEAFIKTSIEDPEAEIADGYQGGIMPPNYGADDPRATTRRARDVPF